MEEARSATQRLRQHDPTLRVSHLKEWASWHRLVYRAMGASRSSDRNAGHAVTQSPLRIVGAGVAGLTTAIQLARHGASVEVFERRADSGPVHGVRCDAIENWTSPDDLYGDLKSWSIDGALFHQPSSLEVRTFDGECRPVTQVRPLLYVVKRGSEAGCLDWALKRQALDLGVRIRYGETQPRQNADVWAVGSRGRGLFLDTGITFRTSQPNRAVILFDRRIAPRACAYLLVVDGVGTLAVLLTREMKSARELLGNAIDAFRRVAPFDMREAKMRSGFGGTLRALNTGPSVPLAIGEAAGFLDYLWGFGIRYAMLSGSLAARALLEGSRYDDLVARQIAPLVQCSLINRKLYDLAGNRTYRALVRYFCGHEDLHALLRQSYRSRAVRRHLWPWVRRSFLGGSS